MFDYKLKVLSESVVRVKSWDRFKRLVDEQKPNAVAYGIERNGFSPNRELATLRRLFASPKAYYVFLDFPKGEILRERILLYAKTNKGTASLRKKD